MPPFPLRLMIVERTEGTAYGTSPLAVVLMGEVDVHLSPVEVSVQRAPLAKELRYPECVDTVHDLASCDFRMATIHLPKAAGCLSHSFPFPSISGTGSERPAAVRGAPVFRRGAAYLDGLSALRQSRKRGGPFQFCRPLYSPNSLIKGTFLFWRKGDITIVAQHVIYDPVPELHSAVTRSNAKMSPHETGNGVVMLDNLG